ncbi:MAG: NADPH:quinone oxidoreductase family protein [Pseudomonadota bacterium]
MQALLCKEWLGYRGLEYTEVEPPAMRPGCIRIAVHYATISGGQVLVVAGKYQRKPPLPFVPGTEVSGIVLEVADDVSSFKPGDRVAAMLDWGGYGEEAIAAVEVAWRIPDGIDLLAACAVPATYGTAYAAMHWRARIQAGQSVLVFGAAGGVGIAAIEIARQAGAHVIAVARTEERLALARKHGAHETFLNDTKDLGRLLKERNGGRGIDLVFDPVGGQMFEEGLRSVAPEGSILLIGFISGTIPQIPANILLVKNVNIIGFNFGLYVGWTPIDERKRYAAQLQTMMDTLFAGISAGDFTSTSSEVYPIQDFISAFDSIVERRSTGRVLMKIR